VPEFDTSRKESSLSFPPPVPWTPRDVAWGLLGFVLWMLFLLVAALLGERLALPVDMGLVVIFGEVVLLLPVWYFTVHKYGVNWADLGLRGFEPTMVGVGCGLMLLAYIFIVLYANFLALFGWQIQPDIESIFEHTTFPLLLLFGGAIVAPFVEEVFFRGFVFTGLSRKWDWKKAALVSAGLFALAHVVPTTFLPIFILGLVFAFLYQSSGSIWPAILMHTLFNAANLLAVYALSQGWISIP
jgi:membrane protease YdiL (CAAX protease family)